MTKSNAVLVLALLVALAGCQFSPSDYVKEEAPLYPVDLNLPPGQRWNSFPDSFCKLLKDFEGKFVEHYVASLFKTREKYDEVSFQVYEYLNDESNADQREELQGLADKCQLTFSYLAMYNFMYEFGQLGGCTAVTYRSSKGVFLMKNLDYNFHELFSQVVFRARYFHLGHELFEGEQLFGFLGVCSASNGEVAATLNARSWRKPEDLNKFIAALKDRTLRLTVWNTRKLFETRPDFDAVVKGLGDYEHQAPAYFTVADLKDKRAAVITRGFGEPAQREDLQDWFLVQTNQDRHITNDHRRLAAETKLSGIGNDDFELSSRIFEEVFAQSPNFMIVGKSKDGKEPLVRTISTSFVDPTDLSFKIFRWRLKDGIKAQMIAGSDDGDLRI